MLSCHVIRHAGTSTCCMLVYVLVCVYLCVYATPMAAADQLPLEAIVSPDARTVWRCVSSCVCALSLVCVYVYLCICILYIFVCLQKKVWLIFFHLTSFYFSAYACVCVCVCVFGGSGLRRLKGLNDWMTHASAWPSWPRQLINCRKTTTPPLSGDKDTGGWGLVCVCVCLGGETWWLGRFFGWWGSAVDNRLGARQPLYDRTIKKKCLSLLYTQSETHAHTHHCCHILLSLCLQWA